MKEIEKGGRERKVEREDGGKVRSPDVQHIATPIRMGHMEHAQLTLPTRVADEEGS